MEQGGRYDMSTAESGARRSNSTPPAGANGVAKHVRSRQRLHRVQTVRLQQGMSLRTAARQLGSNVRETRSQEDESFDLRLSDLYRWQAALSVPIGDLLVDPGTPLSTPVMERAQMVRLMKTAMALLELAPTARTRRLAQTLVEQLVEVMPELDGIGPWHSVGQRRSLDEYGRIVERCVPDDFLQASHLDNYE